MAREAILIAARLQERARRHDTGFTRVGPLMAGILAEAYASAHGAPDAPARAGGAE